ncbi:MAG: ATP-binding protein [Vicinamibacterales bacterium]
MRFSIKQKQVLGVTAMVAMVVTALSLLHLVNLAGVLLQESRARAELLANGVYNQAKDVVTSRETASGELRSSRSVLSAVESAIYSRDVVYAVIVDAAGTVLASSDPAQVGTTVPARVPLNNVLAAGGLSQLRAVYATQQTLEWSQPIALGDEPFGEIRIGLSTLLVRNDLNESLAPAALAAGVSLLVAVLVAMLLAQLVLRPMHVIRSSLTRLGRGDLGVTLDLRDDEELRELGDVFDRVSEQLRAASREDFNPAQLTKLARRIQIMGRQFSGVPHELKNPLNAMTIHLELLKQKLANDPAVSHVDVIRQEVRRLDERVQALMRFVKPEEVTFAPVPVAPLLATVLAALRPEAERANVTIYQDCADRSLVVEGDAALLRDAFLNLVQNAVQAMPKGGRLSLRCEPVEDGRRIRVRVEDTGVGIPPENLERIFELYFTTKEKGTGMGLALVFRTIQIHDGTIDVESTVGVGTAFVVVLPAA